MALCGLYLVVFTSILLCVVSNHLLTREQADRSVIINTKYGYVKGCLNYTADGEAIASFLGIPFAKPPMGKLRFKEPQPPDSWNGTIRDASNFGKRCMQSHTATNEGDISHLISEDCLYLNVYVRPLATPMPTIPVMVWIHGGGYTTGSGSVPFYNGTRLAQKGVIVVTINYRLDVFGYMSTEDDVMPGNYGMLDQIAALRWVRDNIGNFGGDPHQVTIFGESAGGSSVSLLTMSPLAEGLFKRAIMESGASLSPWGFQHPGNRVSPRDNTVMLANSTGVKCGGDLDSSKLLSCLQAVDADKLLNASLEIGKSVPGDMIGPRVETTFGFLPDLPQKLMSSGKINHVDTMQGFNSDETGYFIAGYHLLQPNMTSAQVMDAIVHFWLLQLPQKAQQDMFTLLKAAYITDPTNITAVRWQALESQNDIALVGPTLFQLNSFVSNAPEKRHYLYEFAYRPSWSRLPEWMSAVHTDEIGFVFGVDPADYHKLNVTSDETQVIDQVMDMWTNFAKSGDPTIKVPAGGTTWRPYRRRPKGHDYLLIGQHTECKVWPTPAVPKSFESYLQKLEGI